jgi:hypothetical protein
MILYFHPMEYMKLFGIIPVSGKDTTLGAGHPAHPDFQTVFIEPQTPKSSKVGAKYLNGHFLDRSAVFTSLDRGPAEISLMAAGHYCGTRFAYQHPEAQCAGLGPSNILYFSLIVCLTYSLATKLYASLLFVKAADQPREAPVIGDFILT